MTRIPSGLRGLTQIFQFFVDSVNEKLAKPEYLNFDPEMRLVQNAVDALVVQMAELGQNWLPRASAKATIDALLAREGYEQSLFRGLLMEGVISEDRWRTDADAYSEVVRFAYERFSDHLIAQRLLADHLNEQSPAGSFRRNRPLGALLADERAAWMHRGVIEALCIQLPERIHKELPEVMPRCAGYQPVRQAFVEGFIWRAPTAFSQATWEYINHHVLTHPDAHDAFLDAWLTVATNPSHPYNAAFLHKQLIRSNLPDRDAWWSIFVYRQYGQHGAVDRLIEWAWSVENKAHIGDDAIRLCCIALTWFLTTSHRFARDRATKALTAILTSRLHILQDLLQPFADVNDPYVVERLYAAAYGCALRSTEVGAVGRLAAKVYHLIFETGEPPAHLLLRDYARGIVEVALQHGVELGIDPAKIRPPYRSEFPSRIPTIDEIKSLESSPSKPSDASRAQVAIYHSVMGHDDFARYIIGTNHHSFHWSARTLRGPRKLSRKQRVQQFEESLTKRQKLAWDRYKGGVSNFQLYQRWDEASREEHFRNITETQFREGVKTLEGTLRATLDKAQKRTLREVAIPHLYAPEPLEDDLAFDLSIAQRWILQRVFELGWTVGRFGEFDRSVNRYSNTGRSAHKPERIGKKYQWIAYHEFLARVADQFEFREESGADRPGTYEGPWQLFVRDIDPSCLLTETRREEWVPHTPTWWFPSPFNAWQPDLQEAAWIRDKEAIPAAEPLIEVTDPADGSEWFVLEGLFRWEQPIPAQEERSDAQRREICYLLKSYLVRSADMHELFRWTRKQNFQGRWMPESRDLYRVFLGEYHRAPAYRYHEDPYYSAPEWTRDWSRRLPKSVCVTAERYLHEDGGFDCSINKTISIHLPSRPLAEEMGLRWNGVEGCFFDERGELVARDPSVREAGPSALLVRKDSLLRFLREHNYDLLWTVLGEKQIIGGNVSADNWQGRLEINGAFRLWRDGLVGALRSVYRSPRE